VTHLVALSTRDLRACGSGYRRDTFVDRDSAGAITIRDCAPAEYAVAGELVVEAYRHSVIQATSSTSRSYVTSPVALRRAMSLWPSQPDTLWDA
jgi:hypothetical protein